MPLTPRTIRSRPSLSSSRRSSASSTSAYSARSEGSCETLRPDGVTSWRTTRAAASCSATGSARAHLARARGRLRAHRRSRGTSTSRSSRDPGLALALPQPLQHELEVGSLDAGFGRRLVEHRLDERFLGRELLAGQLAVAGERAEDRGLPGLPVEPVEAQQVREELGDPAGELVELREGVVAQREQDVDAQAGAAQELRQRRTQWPFETVVEDVLLEVVEQQMELPALLRGGRRPCRRAPPSRRARRTRRAPTRSAEPRDPRPTRRARRPARRSARAAGVRRRRPAASSCRRRSVRRGR